MYLYIIIIIIIIIIMFFIINSIMRPWGSILEHNAKHIGGIMRSIMLRSRSIMLQHGFQVLLYIPTKSCPTPAHYASRAWHNALPGLAPGDHLQGLGLRFGQMAPDAKLSPLHTMYSRHIRSPRENGTRAAVECRCHRSIYT